MGSFVNPPINVINIFVANICHVAKLMFNERVRWRRGSCELTFKISGEDGDVWELEDSAKDRLLT